jgi:hypothetical protein
VLNISATHPFEACAAFAVRLLARLAAGDMAAAEALIDVNTTGRPFAESFPAPNGFTYAHPDQMSAWSMTVLGANVQGLRLDFELRFAEAEYQDRPMYAQFELRRIEDQLEVRLTGVVPS